MKSILSRSAITAIVPALLIAATPVAAKPVPKAPTITKAQDAITSGRSETNAQSNPKNKNLKKNIKIESQKAPTKHWGFLYQINDRQSQIQSVTNHPHSVRLQLRFLPAQQSFNCCVFRFVRG
jgi:hypothetical protein